MLIACALPFHFQEIVLVGGGALAGALIIGRICWSYLRAKFFKKDCHCDCCEHGDTEEKQ